MASQSDKTQIFQEPDEVLYARIVSIVGNLYKVPDAVKVDEPWKVYREAVTDLQNTEVLYDRSRFLTRNHTGTISVNDTCIYGKMQHIMANGDCVNGVLWFQILAQLYVHLFDAKCPPGTAICKSIPQQSPKLIYERLTGLVRPIDVPSLHTTWPLEGKPITPLLVSIKGKEKAEVELLTREHFERKAIEGLRKEEARSDEIWGTIGRHTATISNNDLIIEATLQRLIILHLISITTDDKEKREQLKATNYSWLLVLQSLKDIVGPKRRFSDFPKPLAVKRIKTL